MSNIAGFELSQSAVGISAALFQHRRPSQHGQALARPNSRTGERRDAKQRGRGGEWRCFGTRRQTEFAGARSKNIWALLDRCRELAMVIGHGHGHGGGHDGGGGSAHGGGRSRPGVIMSTLA